VALGGGGPGIAGAVASGLDKCPSQREIQC
jgi:hypothetical protein